jgi:RNA polymerase sigma-70 factor (ECF subfamily)
MLFKKKQVFFYEGNIIVKRLGELQYFIQNFFRIKWQLCTFYSENSFFNPTIFMLSSTTIENPVDLLEQAKCMIQDCIAGDRHAQNKLYELFAPKMFAVCLRYTKNREEAEDILQDGFIQVFKSLETFKYAGSFEGWIRKIMVYAALAHFRNKSKMYVVANIENVPETNLPENEEIISRLGRKELMKIIQALPPMYRMIFNLYVFEGLKHREIADLLGIAEGTSKSNFYDAKVILKKAVLKSMEIPNKNLLNG